MSSEVDVASAQEALDALFSARVQERDSSAPVFELKEVQGDDRPVLIQCCIR